ncbi:glycine--tRNA ligase [Patescibacteria group bacterium]|nr:glycine--tRNA ligase [Patescibacteria group bacterium]MBU1673751.1 glycine--tRNA ligase [Patescibacteria group bacterium]MBU1964091.1 glycine--tRNA ligase [Patescibacteria group bacterium]
MPKNNDLMDKIVSLSKRRGFIFQSSEIYGGLSSSYDYGPLGVELKNNIKKAWWKTMVQDRDNIVGLDAAIIMSPKVWEASGHLTAGFADPLRECKKCHHRFRTDNLEGDKCPDCGGELTEERQFNLMMKTNLGVVEDEASVAYLRAETCQGIYCNFKNVLDSMHMKLPFGIAQIGKSFRNEITPGNFTFRTREFEQMEMQYFISPDDSKKYFDEWKNMRMKWYEDLGVSKDGLKFEKHGKDDLAHYAKAAEDVIYKFPFGWSELEGIHDRGDWDLSNHQKHSRQKLEYFDQENNRRFVPHVIETSGGVDRATLMFIADAYTEDEAPDADGKLQTRTVLKFDKRLAPIKVAVLPLSKKEELSKVAREVYDGLKDEFMTWYDETQAIGKRYRRQDEVGTPYCVTVDFESLEDKSVTVRDRDTMKQERIRMDELKDYLIKKLA